MKNLIHSFVRNSVFSNLLMLIIVLTGLAAASQMIREVLPSFSVESIQVTVPYPGAGPEEVEEGVILKVEEALEGIQGIKDFTTSSSEGVGLAIINVDPSYDLQLVKDRVSDKINSITTFPDDAENPSISELIIRRDTMFLAITGDIPERQLKRLADEIKDELIDLPEVSDVSVNGAREYEISIEISEENLRRYGLTFDQVSASVRESSINLPGGDLKSDQQEMTLRTLGRKYTGNEYGEIVLITSADGTNIYLRDVATIKDGFVEETLESRFNGVPSVTVAVYNSDSEDALNIADAVQKYVKEKNALLPDGVKINVWLDSTQLILQRIELLLRNGKVGLLLVFLLLWIFLDLRLAFWVTLGIPISLCGAFALMYMVGETINMISLFAMLMVLGIIVDDAIVVGEAIYVQRKMGKGPIQAAVDGTAEVALPIIAAVVTTMIAFVPLLFVDGIMGKFISVIPTVVISALAISLVEGLLVLPAHLNNLPEFPKDEDERKPGIAGKIKFVRLKINAAADFVIYNIYEPFIRWVLGFRYITLALSIVVMLVTVGLINGGFVKTIFFPKTDSSFMVGQVEFPEGVPVDQTRDAVLRMEKSLLALNNKYKTFDGDGVILGVQANIGQKIGLDGGASAKRGSNVGEIIVELADSERRSTPFTVILKEWREGVGTIAGAQSVTFQEVSGGPPGLPIEIWFTGKDLGMLQKAADEAKERLGKISGVYQIQDDFRPGKKEVRTQIKEEAESLGFTNLMLAQQIRQGFYGDEVLRVQREKDEVKVWVRYPREERKSLADVDQVRLRTQSGQEVPLYTVADVTVDNGYTTIRREDGRRLIRVTADIFGESVNANDVLDQIKTEYLDGVPQKYPGVTATLDGEQAENQESLASLKIGFPLALLGIYLIIATVFRSYIQPLIIMITVPFGIIGAVFGHMIMGYDISIMSMFGMVALTGVVVNDAIVSIEAINDRLAKGSTLFEAVANGGVRRFRAIFLTSATTIGGLLPLVLERSFQAQFLIPMGLTIAAGVAFATILTLVLIPCLFMIMNDARRIISFAITGTMPTPEEVEPAVSRLAEDDDFFKHKAIQTSTNPTESVV